MMSASGECRTGTPPRRLVMERTCADPWTGGRCNRLGASSDLTQRAQSPEKSRRTSAVPFKNRRSRRGKGLRQLTLGRAGRVTCPARPSSSLLLRLPVLYMPRPRFAHNLAVKCSAAKSDADGDPFLRGKRSKKASGGQWPSRPAVRSMSTTAPVESLDGRDRSTGRSKQLAGGGSALPRRGGGTSPERVGPTCPRPPDPTSQLT